MRRIRRFSELSVTKRWLLIKAAFLLEMIKLAMRFVPFKVLRRLVDEAGKVPIGRGVARGSSVGEIAWAVNTASLHIPGEKTCLTQALAAQVLLTRQGYLSLLHIGVFKDQSGELQAHAWVECEHEVVIGGHELERYTTLMTLEGSKT